MNYAIEFGKSRHKRTEPDLAEGALRHLRLQIVEELRNGNLCAALITLRRCLTLEHPGCDPEKLPAYKSALAAAASKGVRVTEARNISRGDVVPVSTPCGQVMLRVLDAVRMSNPGRQDIIVLLFQDRGLNQDELISVYLMADKLVFMTPLEV